VNTTKARALGIVRTQVTTLASRLIRRLARTVRLTETPRLVTFVALDITGFGSRTSDEQERLRRRLFAAVKVIRHGLGNLMAYDVLDRGDGVMVLLPGAIDALRVLEDTMPGLARRVDRDNDAEGGRRMLLRCVVHRGHAQRDRWGWVGDDVNLVFRLLDSETLKIRRGEDDRSPLIVALSETVHDDLCDLFRDEQLLENHLKGHWHHPLMPETFRAKEIEQTAWIASIGGI
jgi:class 3 adenylate cyclase